jgi:hypothetical protein
MRSAFTNSPAPHASLGRSTPSMAMRRRADERPRSCMTSRGAVPHWPKIHRGRLNVEGIRRFRPVDEYTVYAGIWYDKYHTGTNRGPKNLALAYDFVASGRPVV